MFKRNALFVLALLIVILSAAAFLMRQSGKSGTDAHLLNYTEPKTGMEFVLVKGGCFDMGDTFGVGYGEERPVHRVCVGDFYISKNVTTQAQWQAIMGTNPTYFQYCGLNCPVVDVSWEDVQRFIVLLNQYSAHPFRFPTEAEWEYAARSGGRQEEWAGTSNLAELDFFAWHSRNSDLRLHPVGQKKRNGLGIYDMTGHVWEWVADWYDSRYYSYSPKDDPQGPKSGINRVCRGGSFRQVPGHMRASYRNAERPDHRSHDKGFRLAQTP